MSRNYNKTAMCNLCGKVMRGDNLKKHKDRKHSNFDTSLHHVEARQPIADLLIDDQHNDEVKAKDRTRCVYCVKVFPTQEALDNHVHQMHQIRQKDLEQCTSTVTFKHPFTMIVAGPTRSGKTTWVAKLIQNRLRQIKPTPSRVLWCYMD